MASVQIGVLNRSQRDNCSSANNVNRLCTRSIQELTAIIQLRASWLNSHNAWLEVDPTTAVQWDRLVMLSAMLSDMQ